MNGLKKIYIKVCKLFDRCWEKWCHRWRYIDENRRICRDCGVEEWKF